MTNEPTLPIFEAYPALRENVPWISIGNWPTPVTFATNFAAAHGLSSLHIKREDQSHPVCGGQKPRGLEFLLAHAIEKKADTLVTMGAMGSHHVAKTAWHARQFGMDTIALLVDQPMSEYVRTNLGVALNAGARLIAANYATVVPKMAAAYLGARLSGQRPYYVPPGGTSPRACLGHVNAAFELRRQIERGELPEPDYIFVPMGSLGTAAGLLLGCKLAGLRSRVVGVAVSYLWYCTAGRCARIARRTARFMGPSSERAAGRISSTELDVVKESLGSGYALFNEPSLALASELNRLDGIRLDGTYTGKTLHGMIEFIRRNKLENRRHLFWNTYQQSALASDDPDSLPRSLRRRVARSHQRWLPS